MRMYVKFHSYSFKPLTVWFRLIVFSFKSRYIYKKKIKSLLFMAACLFGFCFHRNRLIELNNAVSSPQSKKKCKGVLSTRTFFSFTINCISIRGKKELFCATPNTFMTLCFRFLFRLIRNYTHKDILFITFTNKCIQIKATIKK